MTKQKLFYQNVIGFDLVEDTPFAIVMCNGDEHFRIQKVESFAPQPFAAHGWKVDNIGNAVANLAMHGVETIRYEFLE